MTVAGEANHAGSTAMADRKDALVAAAGFINKVPEIVKEYGNEFTVATVGTIKVTPHSVNVIPGTCTFSLEIRDQSAEVMKLISDSFLRTSAKNMELRLHLFRHLIMIRHQCRN